MPDSAFCQTELSAMEKHCEYRTESARRRPVSPPIQALPLPFSPYGAQFRLTEIRPIWQRLKVHTAFFLSTADVLSDARHRSFLVASPPPGSFFKLIDKVVDKENASNGVWSRPIP